MRRVLAVVAPVINPGSVAADGVYVVQTSGVQVDGGGACCFGCRESRETLVVERVCCVVGRARGEDAAGEGRDEELFFFHKGGRLCWLARLTYLILLIIKKRDLSLVGYIPPCRRASSPRRRS